jgi:hypothetical protein
MHMKRRCAPFRYGEEMRSYRSVSSVGPTPAFLLHDEYSDFVSFNGWILLANPEKVLIVLK